MSQSEWQSCNDPVNALYMVIHHANWHHHPPYCFLASFKLPSTIIATQVAWIESSQKNKQGKLDVTVTNARIKHSWFVLTVLQSNLIQLLGSLRILLYSRNVPDTNRCSNPTLSSKYCINHPSYNRLQDMTSSYDTMQNDLCLWVDVFKVRMQELNGWNMRMGNHWW